MRLGAHSLTVKRDDLSSPLYGGNKVRKLEFILAEAAAKHAREVLTFGYAGSNHALATAYWARHLGIASTLILLPQASAHYVRRNILADIACGARLRHVDGLSQAAWTAISEWNRSRERYGRRPFVIAPGGSSVTGALGFVAAAFELADQVRQGLCPVPDRLYVPLGSGGTVAGLAIGMAMAGLRTTIVGVRVVERRFIGRRTVECLYRRMRGRLSRSFGTTIDVPRNAENVEIRHDYFGEGYARVTAEARGAARLAEDYCGLQLEGTYTAKAFACLVDDALQGKLRDQHAMFWHTYSSADLSSMIGDVEVADVPKPFLAYFDGSVEVL